MKLVALSDTHCRHSQLVIPPCDILIHAGDWTSQGYKHEIEDFAKWLNEQTQCKEIIATPGNHELFMERYLPKSLAWFTDHCPRAHLLIDQGVELFGVKIYGTPVQPAFYDWAYNRADNETGKEYPIGYGKVKYYQSIKPHFDAIPNDTNILITHGPPYGILDQTTYANGDLRPEHLGSVMLDNRIQELKELDLHFFGHIHSPGGTQIHRDGVSFYNCSICDETYYPGNPLTIVDYEKE